MFSFKDANLAFGFPFLLVGIPNINDAKNYAESLNDQHLDNCIGGGMVSKDAYIVENLDLKNFKESLTIIINQYGKNVLGYEENDFYITQSWINYYSQNSWHKRHNHPNSIISGVIYLKGGAGSGETCFCPPSPHIQPRKIVKKENPFTWPFLSVPFEVGKVLLFPSEIEHFVTPHKSGEERITLAFNTWCTGPFGNTKELTELLL